MSCDPTLRYHCCQHVHSPSPIDVFAVQETAVAGTLDPAFCARVGPS